MLKTIKECLNLFKNKRIGIVVAHQDDEILFCGQLLFNIKDISNVTVIAVIEPSPNRLDTNTRINSFNNLCDDLKVNHKTPIVKNCSPDRSFTSKEIDLIRSFIDNFDIVITHNAIGEYGHNDHKAIHNLIKKSNLQKISFGVNLYSNMIVKTNVEVKKKLYSYYQPNWDPYQYSFALSDEYFMIEEENI